MLRFHFGILNADMGTGHWKIVFLVLILKFILLTKQSQMLFPKQCIMWRIFIFNLKIKFPLESSCLLSFLFLALFLFTINISKIDRTIITFLFYTVSCPISAMFLDWQSDSLKPEQTVIGSLDTYPNLLKTYIALNKPNWKFTYIQFGHT